MKISINPPRCDICGRFISWKDFESSMAIRWLITPDTEYSNEEFEAICKIHLKNEYIND